MTDHGRDHAHHDTAHRGPRKAAVMTASDSASRGEREDVSGPTVAARLQAAGFAVEHREVVPDDRDVIARCLRRLADDEEVSVIAITGGTGFAPRDVTPEATTEVIDRPAPGLAEAMRAAGRAVTPLADLSRGVCGVRGRTLILNLPGSPKAASESLDAVISLLPHALDLLSGEDPDHPVT